MTARDAITLVVAVFAVPLAATAAYWWRNADRIARDRTEAFAEDGAWAGWVFPWQRTAWGVRSQAIGTAAAALFLLVGSFLEVLGIGPTFS